MKVVDTSAVVAVLLGESGSEEVERRLMASTNVMSAATWVELGIVVEGRAGPEGILLLAELMARANIEVVPVDRAIAEEAMVCWRRFGKGRHRARLNLGDTFAYALARHLAVPLLFVGDDFSRTDVLAA